MTAHFSQPPTLGEIIERAKRYGFTRHTIRVPGSRARFIYLRRVRGTVLELEGELASALSGERVTVFETSEARYRNLRSVDRDLVVSAVRSGQELLYRGAITDTGRLEGAGVTFDKRIHGFHTGRGRPAVIGPAIPDEAAVSTACAWATVHVQDRLPATLALFDRPPDERWEIIKDDPFERRVAHEDRKLFSRPDRPLVSRPVPKTVYEGKKSLASGVELSKVDHELVQRMVMRKRE